jgi:hypothetical protein
MATGKSGQDDDQLQLLLDICEDSLMHASPAARSEVDGLLLTRGITGGPGWPIDMLSLTRLHLQNRAHHGESGSRRDG